RRMNLQRKFFTRVENFRQQRKTCRVGDITEDRLPILHPKFVQCLPLQRSLAYYTLRLWTIDNLPRFADACIFRQLLSKQLREFASAPDSLHDNQLEGVGTCTIGR